MPTKYHRKGKRTVLVAVGTYRAASLGAAVALVVWKSVVTPVCGRGAFNVHRVRRGVSGVEVKLAQVRSLKAHVSVTHRWMCLALGRTYYLAKASDRVRE